MSKEIQVFNPTMPITRTDLDNAKERRSMLRDFVQSQMRQEVDFGTIPGTQRPSLFQPGAQKLAQLFGFGVRTELTHKEIDLHMNFAMFNYKAEVYHLATGTVISQCEGSCNSKEKKYATRRTRAGSNEETPIGDVMNTLMKMAQKRAYVGAIIQATGASDFYTQDIDDVSDAESLGIKAVSKTNASVPKVTRASSSDLSQAIACPNEECDGKMMVSKFNTNEFYCPKCKSKKPKEAVS